QIEGNAYGIYTGGSNNANYHDPMPRVNGNNFENNSSYAYQARNYANPSTTALDATSNWWGVSSINEINTVLYDFRDTPSSPLIDYANFVDTSIDFSGDGNDSGGGLTQPFSVRDLASTVISNNEVELSWELPAFNVSDIRRYHVSIVGGVQFEVLAPAHTYRLTNLDPSTLYRASVVTIDRVGNESAAVFVNFATPFPNPTGLSGIGRSNLADLSWANPADTSGINQYRIYQNESSFTDITGLQSVLEVEKNKTATSIGGLTNDTDYFFAITSVNASGYETKAVNSVLVSPEVDNTAPAVSKVTFGAIEVVSGFTAANDDVFCAEVSDVSKISRVEFLIDSTFVDSDSTAADGYCFNFRVSEFDDASHQISVVAYDVFENVEPVNYSVSVLLAPPSAPVISEPTNGLVTNQQILDIVGTSMPGLEVQATVNTIEGEWSTINATGQFSIPVFLGEQGDNTIVVRARNRSGEGAYTAAIIVELDTTLPAKPIGVNAEVKDNGIVSLGWSTGSGGRIESFEIYRSDSDVFDIPNTGKINSNTVTSTSFSDLVVDDGTYYYKVVSLNEFGVRSEASLSASAAVDVTDPFAETIEYSTDGEYDAASDTYGRGNLSIALSVNEPLLTTPFLSISPDGGVPISVALSQSDESDTVYNGRIILDEQVRSGTAYAVFSARDKAGNRGTNVNSGQQIKIDTASPTVVGVTSDPASPIKNDSASPVTLTVAFNLDESLSASVAPTLKYSLSSSAGDPQEANSVVKLADKSWQASISLPSNAGADQAETLSLFFEGEDSLGNRTVGANPISTIQVYQGDLPALEAPFNFRGKAISGGRVSLEWFEVQQASAYTLYRKSETDADFTLLVELTTGESYTDQTPIDGDYQYQLSSVRSDNGELAESARTAPLSITTDSISPPKPEGLTLELFPIGIQAEWGEVSEAGVSYQLYTAESGPITDVSALTAILEGLNQPFVVDTNASQSKPAYTVVAVDSIGNKSEPSETAYLNVDLLPVASIKVRLLDGQVPTLSWSHSKPSIDSFDVFFGQQGQTVQLNDATISGNQYIDVGYSNESKTYSVVAIDVNDERSLPRFISLPKVELEIAQGQQIKRNLINVIDVTVANLSDQPISNARINLLSDQANFKSSQVDIAANAEITVPITVGGLESLPDLWQPSLELHSQPNAGESIEIAKTISMDVRDGALALSFETQDFIRGADGTVRLSIENSGDQAIQLITATNQGKSDSPDVLLSLRDEDDNVLSVVGMRQALGEGVVNNVAGEAILTLAAGERWQSEPITVSVPLNAPETVFLSAVIRNMYANRGTPEQVTVKGPSSRQQIVLTETPYRGEITSITPDNSFGREPIVIKGRALERETDRLLSNVDLQIIISLNGFERSFEVLTDSAGEFELSYQSQDGESGVYKVSVLHPIQTSRPNSGEFVISRLTVSPSVLNLRIPYDLAYNIPISFRAGEGTELNNLSFAVEAAQQANGQLPQGIEFAYPSIAKLTSLQRITENITITADNTADENGEFIVSIYADESPDTVIGTIKVAYAFSEAKPSLAFTPSILELGSTLDTVASGSITLENKGLASLQDVRVTLKTADGFPASDWIKLTTQNSLGDIAVGESAKADILLQPNNAAPTGVEHFVLEVKSANAPTYQVPIVTSIVESGEGGILIKVTDMYSGTLNSVGQIIQGLDNANVRIQNESDPSIEFALKADELGEVLVEDIPAGRYSVWVSAPNYREVHQRMRIQPGFIASEQIFLDYELIKLEWTVNEITLEDRYEITLRATFETDVPAAVVMIEPTNIKLPPMEQGDVFYGELIMTNYGLIRAFDINFVPQQSDEFYQFEYLTSVVPESLEAKEQVVVPYKVTALRSLEQQDATGGGCGVYTKCASVACKSNCPTGVSETDSSSCVSISYGSCGGETGFTPPYRPTYGDGGPIYIPGGGGGGANDPLPQGGGFPRCRAGGGDCGVQRGGGAK
ncbi:MAG: fibronectin type 3 domain-containing protein, partial [Arenicella sp.]